MSELSQTPVAVIGLGAMGGGVANRLLDLGCQLSVYNRTASAADPFVARGARHAATPAEAATPGGVAISFVANDSALEEVSLGQHGLVAGLGKDGLHISMSTVSAGVVQRLAESHRAAGNELVSAPVFGRGEAAAGGKLWIALSGPDAARRRAEPILRQLGQGVFDFGSRPEAAVTVKIAGNFLIVAATEAMGESFALLQKNGIDPAAFQAMMSESIFGATIYKNYGPLIIERKFDPPGFKLALAAKDIGLVMDAAVGSRTPMPMASLVRDKLTASLANGRGELDLTSMALLAARDAGLDE